MVVVCLTWVVNLIFLLQGGNAPQVKGVDEKFVPCGNAAISIQPTINT